MLKKPAFGTMAEIKKNSSAKMRSTPPPQDDGRQGPIYERPSRRRHRSWHPIRKEEYRLWRQGCGHQDLRVPQCPINLPAFLSSGTAFTRGTDDFKAKVQAVYDTLDEKVKAARQAVMDDKVCVCVW
mmetsp:Transcript_38231/g.77876  ORF Transcript_38231/g.77876 Transcript_38231/m.77876 type:complete len:127 (+) Transcript_38231:138-518(+)